MTSNLRVEAPLLAENASKNGASLAADAERDPAAVPAPEAVHGGGSGGPRNDGEANLD